MLETLRRNAMKRFTYLCLLGVLCSPALPLRAQDKAQEKPKTEEHAKPSIPVKVQVLFTEYDGDKKISSMPYTFTALADERVSNSYGPSATSLRTGVRIPIEVDGKDQKTTYIDVGSNIDCGVRPDNDGRFHVYLNFDRSTLYPNKSAEGERLVSEPNGQPLIRQFRTSENLILKDGQTSDNILSTDPLNGHVIRVSVTINVIK
jgi:hypothetical protein